MESEKKQKLQKGEENGGLIGELPDEILGMILSRLDMKEAARTSVLSHRWIHLWKCYYAYAGSLDFDSKDCMQRLYHLNQWSQCFREGRKYCDWVNKVLGAHKGPTVEQLRIGFDMGREHERSIDSWFRFAIVRRVQKFELDLTCLGRCYLGSNSNGYSFPSGIWEWNLPVPHPKFDRLTSLCLKSVSISEADIDCFLSKCPLLEQLLVENSSALQNLRVSNDGLKHLEIGYCARLEKIEVSSKSLTSFNYAGKTIKISLRNVAGISSVSIMMPCITRPEGCSEFFVRDLHSDLCLSRVQKLELGLSILVWNRRRDFPRKFPEFSNLKDLELKFKAYEEESLLCLISIIDACPCLQKLTLRYRMDERKKKDTPVDRPWELQSCILKDFTQSLKVVEFMGWVGVKADVELADFLIDRTTNSLEKLIFDLRIPHPFGYYGSCYSHDLSTCASEAALHSAKQFEAKTPPGAKFSIVNYSG